MVTAFGCSHFLLAPMPRGRAGPSCHGNKWGMLSLEVLGLGCRAQGLPVLGSLPSASTCPLIIRTAGQVCLSPSLLLPFYGYSHTHPQPAPSLPTLKSMPCLRMDTAPSLGPHFAHGGLAVPHPQALSLIEHISILFQSKGTGWGEGQV